MLICEMCEQRKKDVVLVLDPYQLEIWDAEVWRLLCPGCIFDLCQEI